MIEAIVDKLPNCNFCDLQAQYDAKTIYGSWANMCHDCWEEKGRFISLGLGRGQKLCVATND